ncbi:MAG: PIG-L family deacetylase [Chloroflexi bacterium]|nr:PIG-L family deacetylase [Chloroflexota bacterium]
MNSSPLHILILGAHPDDCDFAAGGTAIRFARAGHQVRLVTLTNGDAGHYAIGGIELARRRYAETQAAAKVAGVEYIVTDIHDGELEPSLANRRMVIRMMREFQADLVLAHRADEYHPDHRAVGVLVQDASYLVGVPNTVPLAPILPHAPVICQFGGGLKQLPPDDELVVVDIDEAFDAKVDMVHCHTSQVYEWLPYDSGRLEQVPAGEAERKAWLRPQVDERNTAERFRRQLIARYGAERGSRVQHAEVFVACPYGARLTPEAKQRLWPL